MNIQEALKVVVNECKDPNAVAYANAALDLGDAEYYPVTHGNTVEIIYIPSHKMMVGKELKVQILYVLSNLASWRGSRAREVKSVLKKASE